MVYLHGSRKCGGLPLYCNAAVSMWISKFSFLDDSGFLYHGKRSCTC